MEGVALSASLFITTVGFLSGSLVTTCDAVVTAVAPAAVVVGWTTFLIDKNTYRIC